MSGVWWVREALVVHERVSVLNLMAQLRRSSVQMAVIVDEFGSLERIVSPTNMLEAVAGDFPEEDEAPANETHDEDGSWLFDGWIDIAAPRI